MKTSRVPSPDQSPDRMASALASQPGHAPTSSPLEFTSLELVELASNPILEGVLGPNKDGRVRNPVPRKLKGRTDNKKGNFGVMHMDMSPGKKTEAAGRDIAAERDAAARRTSENTASRAKAAQHEKYLPPKKRLEGSLSGANRASPFGGREDQKQRARPLTPDETKYEQARLLTLLRSINPVTVVDQICKAVAYFGGIPGAPPPEDGIFPESANTRETGALFIGWLSEIFPDLARPAEEPTAYESPMSNGKKGKGRPSTKARETPNPTNGYGYGQALPAPCWSLPQSLTLVNTHGPTSHAQISPNPPAPPQVAESIVPPVLQPTHPAPTTPTIKQQPEEASPNDASTNKRKRGRPKGSRNKGKNDEQRALDVAEVQDANVGQQPDGSSNQQGAQSGIGPAISNNAVGSAGVFAIATTPVDQPRSDPALTYSDAQWQADPTGQQLGGAGNAAVPDELSPEERAIVEAFRKDGAQTSGTLNTIGAVAVNESPVLITTNAQTGAKRKRAPPKPKANPAPIPNPPPESSLQSVQEPTAVHAPSEGAIGTASNNLQWASVDTSAAAPPNKKQRKPKPTGSTEPLPRKKSTPVVHHATPPIAPRTIPDSTATSQQSGSSSRPPAEGLEAHYERFANLQQQAARSSTPTAVAQQQMRQHQKTSSSVNQPMPQHSQAQANHNTQQVPAREDQSMTSASTRAPSTYYNQRNQSTNYTQQYPSHQTAQYSTAHQASPQLSNNTYRNTSSHTMAQASPRFSHNDGGGTYRTASPHTMAQPSPSYPQTDSTYRTPSSHTLAHPTPSYSQPETPYRSSSAHNLAQTSTSYSARPSQPQTQSTNQSHSHYGSFSDSSYMDLPTLDSLGHASGQGHTNVSMSMNPTGTYGQGLSGMNSTRSGSGSLYRTSSSLSNAFDTSASDLLRNARSSSNAATYGSTSGMRDFL